MGKIKPKCHFGLQKVRIHDLVRGESQEQEEEKEEEGRGEEDQGTGATSTSRHESDVHEPRRDA